MTKKIFVMIVAILAATACMDAQTTTGLITGTVVDSSKSAVAGAQIAITNVATGQVRTTTTGDNGLYTVLLLPAGTYSISVQKQGFKGETRNNIELLVNESDTVDFTLGVAAAAQTVTVTGAAPLLNTTSATLNEVVSHQETVDLPLNGRQFTDLTLLTPGASPQTGAQQGEVLVQPGGVSPAVDGQRAIENNFTMDGVGNISPYEDVWAVSPPPDAIQEFAVQEHITDAQFAVSSGANINVATRSGTNNFHGSLWEFLRNSALDADTYPSTSELPYRQNQYGVYLGGPVLVPHLVHGKNNTWFSAYWEGFRSVETSTILSDTLTPAMVSGDFSGVLGTTPVGTDSLGRPEYANEIYDPLTSRPDPAHANEYLRDPFAGNVIPTSRLNPASLAILQRYYPAPNLNVAEGVLPNYEYGGKETTDTDNFGIRFDHQLSPSDTLFIRFNRARGTLTEPKDFPTYVELLTNYAQQAALGYTHVFSPNLILSFHYGYTYTNTWLADSPSGEAFDQSINYLEASPPTAGFYAGPSVSITNYSTFAQGYEPLGPQEQMQYLPNLIWVKGNHTLGMGAEYYHLRTYDDGKGGTIGFTNNATGQDGSSGPTGFAPASLVLGVPDTWGGWIGNSSSDQTASWYGWYAQDLWRPTKNLAIDVGLRWDYVTPPNYHRITSGLDVLNGVFYVNGPVPPYFPVANGPKGFFHSQYNGWEPRFGVTYRATSRTALHGAFAMLDDHDNTLVLETQETRLAWPQAVDLNLTSLDLGLPTYYTNTLPAYQQFLGSNTPPMMSDGANPYNRIPYSMEFNAGVQQQLSSTMDLKVDYVGSLSRFQYANPTGNTATVPGPGTILSREPYPQYGGPHTFSWNIAPASYNALQVFLEKRLSSTLFFRLAYTYSKSMDWNSDSFTGQYPRGIYDMAAEWGPSTYSFKHMLVLSGVYQLPFGRGRSFVSSPNALVQSIVGNWNLGTIVSLHSGEPFYVSTDGDVANFGGSTERSERNYSVSPYAAHQSPQQWLNPSAFAEPTEYTFGNERRDDLVGPDDRNVDLGLFKDFNIVRETKLEFRAEAFNSLNTTNYNLPSSTVTTSDFGEILGAAAGRELQFALKVIF